RIRHPVELAVLAVADDVDTRIDLLASHLRDGALHPRRERGLVVRFAELLGVEHQDKISRPRQAACVGGQDAADAALHAKISLVRRKLLKSDDSNFPRLSGDTQRRLSATNRDRTNEELTPCDAAMC